MIQHRDMLMWQDKNGRWQCRRVAADTSGVVYRSGARSSGTERLRRKLSGRRRDADDSPMPDPIVGNCGRPANEPCGLLNSSECATHAEVSADPDEKRLHRLIVRARRARLDALTQPPANETRAARLAYIQRLRDRHGLKRIDPRVVAADCAHRMRRW